MPKHLFQPGNPGYGMRKKKEEALFPRPKSTPEAVEALEKLFPAAVETVGKGLQKKGADRNQLMSAQIILDRFVPRLKHTELSGDPDNPLFHLTQIDLARAVIIAGEEARKIADCGVIAGELAEPGA